MILAEKLIYKKYFIKNEYEAVFRFSLLFVTCFALMIFFNDFPRASILSIDLIFCYFIFTQFKSKFRFLFLLHPLVSVVANLSYDVPFVELGDGPAYAKVIKQYIDTSTLDVDLSYLFLKLGVVAGLKHASLGVVPIFAIPEYLYISPESDIYYLWQGTFGVILVALFVSIAKSWKIIRNKYLFFIALYVVISPSFFELRNNPNRYDVLVFAILLFYISFIAVCQSISFGRLVGLLISVALIALSKFALFMPILFFVVYYLIFEVNFLKNPIRIAFFAVILAVCIGLYFNEFALLLNTYQANSSEGAATFSGLTEIPIFGYFFKFLFALLAPFPWHKVALLTESTYGGNYFTFVMHVFSSLFGIYFFLRILIYRKQLFFLYPELRPMLVFGVVMSTSIIFGNTGFHFYLLIYFPFFAPLLAIKKYNVPMVTPVALVAFVELIYVVALALV